MRYFYTLILALVLSSSTEAQIHIDVNFNIESQPVWGPTGYDFVEYYYLPDIDVFYNVPQHRFIYLSNGRWIFSSSLPSRYRGYDLYRSYKVVVNEQKPYRNHNMYIQKYASYKDHHDQQLIRDSRDSKYFVNKNHPKHDTWAKQQVIDRGNGNDRSNGNNRNSKKEKSSKQNNSDKNKGKK